VNENIKYIINKVKEYTGIPSLSLNERNFLNYLAVDLQKSKSIKHYALRDYGSYLHLFSNEEDINMKTLITVHTDRIPVPPYEWKILKDNKLKGQLDNAISIAIIRLLIEKQLPMDVLFTTAEEILQSNDQIIGIYEDCKYKYVVDLDIDVTVKPDEVESGVISLRDHDSIVKYDKELVEKLSDICEHNEINYITKDKDWLMCEIGTTIQQEPKVRGCYLGLPLDNYHSNHEVMNFKCIENAIKLIGCLSKEELVCQR